VAALVVGGKDGRAHADVVEQHDCDAGSLAHPASIPPWRTHVASTRPTEAAQRVVSARCRTECAP
jgi:hypothetical protein